MPYKKGKIEGGTFHLQWISIIFNVNIQVWSSHSMNILSLYPARSTCDKTVDVLSFETDPFHIHYEPLLTEHHNGICNVHSGQLSMALNNPHRVDYHVSMEVPTTTSTNHNVLPPENVLESHQRIHCVHC
jgi:hypothetical protein